LSDCIDAAILAKGGSSLKEDTSLQMQIQTSVDGQTLERARKTSKEFAKLMSYYRCAMLEMETRFNVLNEEYLLEYGRSPINTVKSRLKTLPSLQEKVKRRNITFSLEEIEAEIHDIAGVRVICAFPEDVYTVADALLKQDDILLIKRKDYIAEPKPNGYRSLHLIVAVPVYLSTGKRMTKVEIQIRTIAMDFWASLEHQLRYKQNTVFTEEMARELLECAQQSADLDARMDKLRKSVKNNYDANEEANQ